VGIFVPIGSRDETAREKGLSHFLEHLVFKGTETRSAFDLASALESVGGDLNAYTTKEYTCLHAASLREDLALSLDVLLDLVRNARFNDDDFEKERRVILQEIAMAEDQLEDLVFDRFFGEYFATHELASPILGDPATLKAMTRSQAERRYRATFADEHLIVVVVGDVSHEEVLRIVQAKPGRTSASSRPFRRKKPRPRSFRRFEGRSAEQIHVLLGYNGPAMTDDRRFDGMIVANALGGGMTSRLYQAVREKSGIAYSVYAQLMTFTDLGLFFVYAATTSGNLEKLFELLGRELAVLRSEGLSDDQIEYFRKQVRGQILIGSDDIENRMTSIGVNEMVFGRYRPVHETIAQLDLVDTRRVREYLDQFLDPDRLGLIILGDRSGAKNRKWKGFTL
jgi:predicted Zn-dependent peptidase